MKREKHFATEADLCAAFKAWAIVKGYIVYPETANWDMLLVDADGRQTGVQAKMDLNLKVISQTLNEGWNREKAGPDYRAMLVPFEREGVEPILARCGIGLFVPKSAAHTHYFREHGLHWKFDNESYFQLPMHDWNPSRRCVLPDYVPDVLAGVPSPRTLSPWKVGALRVLALIEVRGYIVRDEIRDFKNDPRRWCASDGWLVPLGNGRWGKSPKTPAFGDQHPDIYASIIAEQKDRLAKRKEA